uniref:Uncharacterized protein n=1 Tax=Branchiostoma floridae TaxID=7739 RepID=C3YYZ5_BRAFL|eukprot:XP_002598491.1 hypothetical protein BRAFLDRAFT_66868 [Branchiostoma floridae]
MKIVPMGADESCKPKTVAVVLSDLISSKSRSQWQGNGHIRGSSISGHEEMMDVTCVFNSGKKTFRQVFTVPVSSAPDGSVCEKKTSTVPDSSRGMMCSEETKVQTTEKPKTTKIELYRTNPDRSNNVTIRSEKGKPKKVVGFMIGLSTVLSVLLIAVLSIKCNIRMRHYCLQHNQAAQAAGGLQGPQQSIVPLKHFMINGPNVNETSTASNNETDEATDCTPYLGNEPQCIEIPDEDFNSQNTLPESPHDYWLIPESYFDYKNTQLKSVLQYWEIPDEYYNYENTTARPLSFPLTQQLPQPSDEEEDDAVTFYTATAEVALPSSTRRGGKHPSYSMGPQQGSQNHLIFGRQRKAR